MNKFFIHIPKNAGMSIRKSSLVKVQEANRSFHISSEYTTNVMRKMAETQDHPGLEHARWRDINPGTWFLFRPFAIVRNPWDRVVSRYFFARKVIEIEKKVPKTYADVASFDSFLEERHKWGNEEYMWHRAVRGWYPAFDHISDPTTGEIAWNIDILRFESLNEDFQDYFSIKEDLVPRNVTAVNKGTYKDLYNDKRIQIVADWYKKDIDTWGYDFDTGPTRNTWRIP